MINHHGWLQPLIGFSDYIGSTLPCDNIIYITIIVFIQSQWSCFTVNVVDYYILKFSVITHHGWLRPLVGIAAYIGSIFPSNYIIAINCLCWSLSIMYSFHCHRCWLLYFEVFLLFLITIQVYFLSSLSLCIKIEQCFGNWSIITELRIYKLGCD